MCVYTFTFLHISPLVYSVSVCTKVYPQKFSVTFSGTEGGKYQYIYPIQQNSDLTYWKKDCEYCQLPFYVVAGPKMKI